MLRIKGGGCETWNVFCKIMGDYSPFVCKTSAWVKKKKKGDYKVERRRLRSRLFCDGGGQLVGSGTIALSFFFLFFF